MVLCLVYFPLLFYYESPCVLLTITVVSQGHRCGLQRAVPRRRPTVTRTSSLSDLRLQDEIGHECSQSLCSEVLIQPVGERSHFNMSQEIIMSDNSFSTIGLFGQHVCQLKMMESDNYKAIAIKKSTPKSDSLIW